ncbi:hypothetical protein, partial [Nostocoides japonicum]|uniref:hypothetical protein n=1 Tax=Nostocoides japonicum TaxID=99481 RepID=UPI001910B6F2
MAVSEGSERVRGGPVATEPADLLSEARRVLHVDGLLARSRELYLAAHEAARSGADAEAAAEAALGLGGLWVHEQRTTAEAMATESRQRRALAMLP